MKIPVCFTTLEEQNKLYDFLTEQRFHWMSGQPVNEPPVFLRNPFSKGLPLTCVRVIDTEQKTIGISPMEILTEAERKEYIKNTVSVEKCMDLLASQNPKKEDGNIPTSGKNWISDLVDQLRTNHKNGVNKSVWCNEGPATIFDVLNVLDKNTNVCVQQHIDSFTWQTDVCPVNCYLEKQNRAEGKELEEYNQFLDQQVMRLSIDSSNPETVVIVVE